MAWNVGKALIENDDGMIKAKTRNVTREIWPDLVSDEKRHSRRGSRTVINGQSNATGPSPRGGRESGSYRKERHKGKETMRCSCGGPVERVNHSQCMDGWRVEGGAKRATMMEKCE